MSIENWEIVENPAHPLKDSVWVATTVEIRDNKTGFVRELPFDDILSIGDEEPSDFIWVNGNYSCDCNRRIFFDQASGGDGNFESACGQGAYSVRVRNKKNGDVFYDEFENNV